MTERERIAPPERLRTRSVSTQHMDGQQGVDATRPRELTPEQRAELETVFAWHPMYRGMTLWQVYVAIRDELRRDQQTFLGSRIGTPEMRQAQTLNQKWGEFDEAWPWSDAAKLASGITSFERARDEKQELFAYGPYKRGIDLAAAFKEVHGRPMLNIDKYMLYVWSWMFRLLPVAIVAIVAGVVWWLLW
jgi:hypothetical protein